tara:strand:- start:36 stop:569 length:534 start_codon:yes stop_codon:yes gene_type:complete
MKEQTVPIGSLGSVLNLSERRIQQLVKEGVLSKEERGRYPFMTNVKGYVMYLQSRVDGNNTGIIDLDEARKRKLQAEAMMAELELERTQENTISVADHGEFVGKLGDALKGRLMVLPSKLAPALALETKQGLCKQIVEDEIRSVLKEISRVISDDELRSSKGESGTKKTGNAVSSAS